MRHNSVIGFSKGSVVSTLRTSCCLGFVIILAMTMLNTSLTSALDIKELKYGNDRCTSHYARSYTAGGIQPYIIDPSNGTNVYSNINVSATELTNPESITEATFEYSINGINWVCIGTDTNGTIATKATDRISYQWGIWAVYWAIASLSEGWYHLRVTMTNTTLHTGQDQVQIYVDPTPPIPTIVKPTLVDGLWATVTGTVFQAVTADENVVSMKVEYLPVPTYYNKSVPRKNQHDYGPLKGKPGTPEYDADSSCGPTSAGACLWYFAKKYPLIYGDLIKEGGRELNQTELIDRLHNETYTNCKEHCPKKNGDGVTDPNMQKGLEEWIKKHGGCLTVEYVKKEDFTFKKYVTELLESEDLLVSTDSHWMVGNSVDLTKNADGTYNVDFMDPWTGQYITVKMSKNGDFSVYGHPKDTMFVICPCSDKEVVPWTPIGIDSYGADGWSVSWDTCGLTPCTWYLIRVTMTDANGRKGIDKILVHIEKPVGGISVLISVPVDKTALLASYIGLASTILVAIVATAVCVKRVKRRKEKQ